MKDGTVYGFGKNGENTTNSKGGLLGVNVAISAIVSTPTKIVFYGLPADATYGAGTSVCTLNVNTATRCVVDVQETGRNTYVLLNDGTVWGAGDNNYGSGSDYGMLAQPISVSYSSTFRQILLPTGKKAAQISADAWQVAILTATGEVYTAGVNMFGSTSKGGAAGCGTPSPSSSTCRYNTSTQLTIDGSSVYLMKFNLPVGVKATLVSNTSIGNDGLFLNTYVLGDDNNIYAAGDNTYGQLGNSCGKSAYAVSIPTSAFHAASPPSCAGVVGQPVIMDTISSTGIIPASVQAGRGTVVIRATTGQVYTAGYNDNGQLGDGTTNWSSTPSANRYTNTIPITIY